MLNHHHIHQCVYVRGGGVDYNLKIKKSSIRTSKTDAVVACSVPIWYYRHSAVTPACTRDKVHRRRRITRAEWFGTLHSSHLLPFPSPRKTICHRLEATVRYPAAHFRLFSGPNCVLRFIVKLTAITLYSKLFFP